MTPTVDVGRALEVTSAKAVELVEGVAEADNTAAPAVVAGAAAEDATAIEVADDGGAEVRAAG
jgi:hypothetical protein